MSMAAIVAIGLLGAIPSGAPASLLAADAAPTASVVEEALAALLKDVKAADQVKAAVWLAEHQVADPRLLHDQGLDEYAEDFVQTLGLPPAAEAKVRDRMGLLVAGDGSGVVHKDLASKYAPIGSEHHQDRLLAYMMEGCTGSSFIGQTARSLLTCLGTETTWLWEKNELLKPNKNLYFDSKKYNSYHNWTLTLHRMQQEAEENKTTVIFKPDLHSGSYPMYEWGDKLAVVTGGRMIIGTRNPLDKHICALRDCFDAGKKGFVIGPDGSTSNLCFKRRTTPGADDYKVHLYVGDLDALRGDMKYAQEAAFHGQQHGFAHTPVVSYEDLSAFEWPGYTDKEIDASVQAWSTVLTTWTVPHSKPGLRKCLRPKFGSYKRPLPHDQEIENWGEVQAKLHSMGPEYEALLRLSEQ